VKGRCRTVALGVLAPLAVLALVAGACSSGTGQGEVRIELRRRFRDGLESGQPVDLGLLVAGDWDRFVVVCPSEPQALVEDRLGFGWDEFPGTVGDDEALFVFPGGDEVVTWARVPRADGDLCAGSGTTYDRDEAVFTVTDDRTADGEPYLTLAPAA
jgi:hypothetical protein